MTEPNQPIALLTDGLGFDSVAQDSDYIFLTISRREVESGNVSDALDRLLNLSDNAEHIGRFEDALGLTFSGYDADSRELHQVPEVVAFMRLLSTHWNYWAHFVDKGQTNTVTVLITLLCDVDVVAQEFGQVGFSFRNPDAVPKVLQSLLDSMNALYEANGIDEEQNMRMTNRFLEAFTRGMT